MGLPTVSTASASQENGNLVIFPFCSRILGQILRPPACTSPSNQNLLLTVQR